MLKRAVIFIMIGVIATRAMPVQAQLGTTASAADPWLQKPVLPYLLLTQDSRLAGERQGLYRALHLSAQEEKALQEIAKQEQRRVRDLYQASQSMLLDETNSSADKQQAVLAHNQGVSEAMAQTDRAVRLLLGSRYPAFRAWIRNWWDREREAISRLKRP
ncbi:MAG: hypothetical protein C4297_15175 [Gemmataceae bacterium]